MGTHDDNKKGGKTKIEQLRIDLEKKMAALGASKSDKTIPNEKLKKEKPAPEEKSSKSTIKDEVSIEETESSKSIIKDEVSIEEIESSQIEEKESIKIDEEPITDPDFDKIVADDKSVFEALDSKESESVTENVGEEFKELEATGIIEASENELVDDNELLNSVVEESDEDIDIESSTDTKIDSLEEEIQEDISQEVLNKEDVLGAEALEEGILENNVLEPEESKKIKLNYLIYGLAGALLLAIGYLTLGFYKETKSFENEKMDRIISKYQNKSYLDSIELADANNQLSDYQNQLLIDSIAGTYQEKLDNNPKKTSNKPNVKKAKEKPKPKPTVKKTNTVAAPSSTNTFSNVFTEPVATTTPIKTVDTPKEEEPKEEPKKVAPIARETMVKLSPIYPGCGKKKTELAKKQCLTSKMLKHIQRKFNSGIAQNIGLKTGVNKIKVSFVVDKNGNANILQVKTNNEKLKKEAIRVVQSLPKMTPGRTNGEVSSTKYIIPIHFRVEN